MSKISMIRLYARTRSRSSSSARDADTRTDEYRLVVRRRETMMREDIRKLPATARAKPWHRQLWSWLLMLRPIVSVVGGIAVLCVAVKTNDGLVADDYYQRSITINERLVRERSAADCAAKDLACAAARSREGR